MEPSVIGRFEYRGDPLGMVLFKARELILAYFLTLALCIFYSFGKTIRNRVCNDTRVTYNHSTVFAGLPKEEFGAEGRGIQFI